MNDINNYNEASKDKLIFSEQKSVSSVGNNNRNTMFDIAKGIGIFLIVFPHALGYYSYSKSFVILFHVGIFFIISGFFFNEKYEKTLTDLKTFVKKRIKTLYFPFVLTNLFFIIFHNLFIKISFLTDNPLWNGHLGYESIYTYHQMLKAVILNLIMYYREVFCAPTGFLIQLFYIGICFCLGSYLLRKIIKNEKTFEVIRFIIVTFCLLLGYYCFLIDFNFYRIGTMLSSAPLFYIGVLFRKNQNLLKINIYTFVLSLIILLICLYYNNGNTRPFFLGQNYYNNPIWLIAAQISGLYFVLGISKLFTKSEIITKAVSFIGRHTISILCLHFLFFKIVTYFKIRLYNLPDYYLAALPTYNPDNSWWWILYCIIGIAGPLLVAFIYQKIKQKFEIEKSTNN